MLERETLRDLLVAELAVEEGLASVADVADLVASCWRVPERPFRVGLADALAQALDLEPAALLRLRARADRLVEEAAGSPETALRRRSTGRASLNASLARRAPDLTAALSAQGAWTEVLLRPMAPERYTDLVPIGEGGMGTVYRALDTDLDRPIALKLVREDLVRPQGPAAAAGAEVVARFLREARLTGRLEHPGIVPVHEVGQTAEGLPYYAMRLVRDSRTLAEALACADGPEQRHVLLEPFLKVCDAVAYAHGQGIVHRDLKPQNVALGRFGEVIVLDWGLAKADASASPRAAEPGARHAGPGPAAADAGFLTQERVLGTVGYVAPEALLAPDRDLDPASGPGGALGEGKAGDVFSLGVILFQILTGRLPWPFPDLVRYAAALAQAAPSAASLEPLAPEGLSEIASRALARDPAERYADAGLLAAAVRDWQRASAVAREHEARAREARALLGQAESLSGEQALRQVERVRSVLDPLLSARSDHPEGLRVAAAAEALRARALAERDQATRRRTLRRGGLAALALLTVAAVTFATVLEERNRDLRAANAAARQAQGLEAAARRRAQGEREQAESVLEFLLYPLRDALQPSGQTGALLETARRAVAYYEGLPAASLSPESLDRFHSSLQNLGHVLQDVGDVAGARVAHGRALLLAERMRAAAPAEARPALNWVRSQQDLAALDQASRDLPAALERDERALELVRAFVDAFPADARWQAQLASTQRARANRLLQSGRAAEAVARLREVLDGHRASERAGTPRADEAVFASTLVDLAGALVAVGEDGQALAALAEARARYEARARAAPQDVRTKSELAYALEREADVRTRRKEPEAAIALAERALALRREAAERDPANAIEQSAFAESSAGYSRALELAGDAEGATRAAAEGVAAQERLVRRRPDHLGMRVALAVLEDRLSRALQAEWRIREALDHARRALDLVRALPPDAQERLEEEQTLEARVLDCEALLTVAPETTEEERRAAVAKDAVGRARDAEGRGDVVVALRNWVVALRVAAVRDDLAGGASYRAARVAARAAAAVEAGPVRDSREALALAWLEDDLRRRRAWLGAAPPEEAEPRARAFQSHLEEVLEREPALASLRARPDFGPRMEAAARRP